MNHHIPPTDADGDPWPVDSDDDLLPIELMDVVVANDRPRVPNLFSAREVWRRSVMYRTWNIDRVIQHFDAMVIRTPNPLLRTRLRDYSDALDRERQRRPQNNLGLFGGLMRVGIKLITNELEHRLHRRRRPVRRRLPF